ncbi:MAG: VWA domain-containing protein [Polyangiales bacterium]
MRVVTLSLVAFLAFGCSSSESPTETLASPGAGCSTPENAGKCGTACTSDDECGAGMYCNLGGNCSADCGTGLVCPQGTTCNAHGQCFADPSSLDGSVSDAPFSDACPNVTVTFEKTIPTVMLLVDQSGSMTENFGGDTRWNVARNALINPTTGVVKTLEKEVRFGLALYSSKNGFMGGMCPLITKVPIAMSNYAAITSVYSKAEPIGDTPTGESIDAVVKDLADPKVPGPKYIVLATDGEPDTCAVPNPSMGQPQAVKAAQDAFAKGISTFYISVGTDVSAGHAQDMANAGQGLPVGGTKKAKYYVASDAASLKSAFDTIIAGVRSCTFKLNGKVVDASKGVVTLDGATLVLGDKNGWKLEPDGTEVTLQGTACEKIKTGDHTINASFACGAVIK